jgi:hypothetical protein
MGVVLEIVDDGLNLRLLISFCSRACGGVLGSLDRVSKYDDQLSVDDNRELLRLWWPLVAFILGFSLTRYSEKSRVCYTFYIFYTLLPTWVSYVHPPSLPSCPPNAPGSHRPWYICYLSPLSMQPIC